MDEIFESKEDIMVIKKEINASRHKKYDQDKEKDESPEKFKEKPKEIKQEYKSIAGIKSIEEQKKSSLEGYQSELSYKSQSGEIISQENQSELSAEEQVLKLESASQSEQHFSQEESDSSIQETPIAKEGEISSEDNLSVRSYNSQEFDEPSSAFRRRSERIMKRQQRMASIAEDPFESFEDKEGLFEAGDKTI